MTIEDPRTPGMRINDAGHLEVDLVEGIHYQREGGTVHLVALPHFGPWNLSAE